MNIADMPVRQFIQKLASAEPTPGGGSVAALSGALSAALCQMVSGVTIKSGKFDPVKKIMTQIDAETGSMTDRCLELTDKDIRAYNDVILAYRLPKDSEDEKNVRDSAIQSAFKTAADVPLQMLRVSESLIRRVKLVIDHGNPNALSDAAAAMHLAKTTAYSAAYNILINLKFIQDEGFVENCRKEVHSLLKQFDHVYRETESAVHDRLDFHPEVS